MSFFDDLTKKLKETGNAALAKTKEIADVAKLNASVVSEERKIREALIEIGKAYVEKYADSQEEPFAASLSVISEAKAKIEGLKAEIEAVKAGASEETVKAEKTAEETTEEVFKTAEEAASEVTEEVAEAASEVAEDTKTEE